ncbi:MAG: PqqD family protein [Rhizomicrobium sp.]
MPEMEYERQQAFRRKGNWPSARIGDQMVVMNATNGTYVDLNETGRRIWEMAENPTTIEEFCDRLCEEYDIDRASAYREISDFLAVMIEGGAMLPVERP